MPNSSLVFFAVHPLKTPLLVDDQIWGLILGIDLNLSWELTGCQAKMAEEECCWLVETCHIPRQLGQDC